MTKDLAPWGEDSFNLRGSPSMIFIWCAPLFEYPKGWSLLDTSSPGKVHTLYGKFPTTLAFGLWNNVQYQPLLNKFEYSALNNKNGYLWSTWRVYYHAATLPSKFVALSICPMTGNELQPAIICQSDRQGLLYCNALHYTTKNNN